MKFSFHYGRVASLAGWVLFGIMMIGVFCLVTFPYEQLHSRILGELSKRTGLRISVDEWNFVWPLGIKWAGVAVRGSGIPRVEAETVELEVSGRSLLYGQPQVHGSAWLRRGADGRLARIKVMLSLTAWSSSASAHLAGTVERLDLSRGFHPMLKQGVMRMEFNQRWNNFTRRASFLEGEGEWQIQLSDLLLGQDPRGATSFPSVTISSVRGRLLCSDGTCDIEALKAKGPGGRLSGQGVLALRLPLQESVLTASFMLTSLEGLKQRVPPYGRLTNDSGTPIELKVSGPLSKLQISL